MVRYMLANIYRNKDRLGALEHRIRPGTCGILVSAILPVGWTTALLLTTGDWLRSQLVNVPDRSEPWVMAVESVMSGSGPAYF